MKHLLFAALLACAGLVQARLTDFGVRDIEPFAEGESFGAAGAYERVSGVARGEIDPRDERNRGIVNIQRAPRNALGMVEYEVDWFMLRPADPSRRNGKIIYVVTIRGRKFFHHWIMDGAAGNDPKTLQDAGNALFLRLGYTIVWSGWDPDAPRANRGMAMKTPVVPGVVRVDRLVMYTDGVIERDTPDQGPFGVERLKALLADCAGASARGTVDRILAAAGTHGAGAPLRDDMTVVVIRKL